MNMHFFILGLLFISSALHGMSEPDSKLFNSVKQSHANYLLDDYLRMTPLQRAEKEKQQAITMQKAVSRALERDDIDKKSSLLAALLMDQDISENVFTYIVNHRNSIKREHIPIILHWYISQITVNKSISNAIIRNIVINFPDSKSILSDDALLLEEQILKNENVNIAYLLYWPELSIRGEKELIKLANKAGETTNMNKWRRNWLAACVLTKFKGNFFDEKILAIVPRLLKNNKRYILIYLPLGLSLTGQKQSIDLLLKLLDSNQISQKTPDAEPPQIELSHEVAIVLHKVVKNFPPCTASEEFNTAKKTIVRKWRDENIGKMQLISRDLIFFLRNTKLGHF